MVILASTLGGAERPKDPKKWLRRVSAIAVCAMSSADMATTAIGTSRGGIEQNGLLSNNGKPMWGRMVAVNVGACGSAIILSEVRRLPRWYVIAGNSAFMAAKATAVAHNLGQLAQPDLSAPVGAQAASLGVQSGSVGMRPATRFPGRP